MKITCPTDPNHKTFSASATVTQLWEVDQTGTFVSEIEGCTDVVHKPESHDEFTCRTCGAKGLVIMTGRIIPATDPPAPIVSASHPDRQKRR